MKRISLLGGVGVLLICLVTIGILTSQSLLAASSRAEQEKACRESMTSSRQRMQTLPEELQGKLKAERKKFEKTVKKLQEQSGTVQGQQKIKKEYDRYNKAVRTYHQKHIEETALLLQADSVCMIVKMPPLMPDVVPMPTFATVPAGDVQPTQPPVVSRPTQPPAQATQPPVQATQPPTGVTPPSIATEMTAEEKKLAQQLFETINQDRAKDGHKLYTWDNGLARSSFKHNELAVKNNSIAHNFPGEPSVLQRISNEGVKYNGYNATENVGSAYGETPYQNMMRIHEAMMAERPCDCGHYKALMSDVYERIGLAVRITASGSVYVTEHFADYAK